jgi:hypothetical protein
VHELGGELKADAHGTKASWISLWRSGEGIAVLSLQLPDSQIFVSTSRRSVCSSAPDYTPIVDPEPMYTFIPQAALHNSVATP